MDEKTYKRTYYFPKILMDIFQEWCKPGREYSTKIAGAILYYMSLEPNVRESCETIACKNKKAIKDKIAQLAEENRLTGLFDEKRRYPKPVLPAGLSDEWREVYEMLDECARSFATVHEKIQTLQEAKLLDESKSPPQNRASSAD